MAMKMTGVSRVKSLMTQKINDIGGKVTQQSMLEGIILGGNYAALLTPVDTANLINSQFYNFPTKTPTGWTASVSYTANYAQFVHDGPQKNWQKSGASNMFLLKGFSDNKEEIFKTITGNYKR